MGNTDSISRKSFIKEAAVAGAAAIAATAATRPVSSFASEAASEDTSWDKEADIVVVGFGSAGSAAAMDAANAGCSVIVLEKMPEGQAGGNTSCFGGIFAQSPAGGLTQNSFGTIDEATAENIESESARWVQWGAENGMEFREDFNFLVKGAGPAVYAVLKQGVLETTGIEVMYETPAVRLVQDPSTREVLGVVAEKDSAEMHVKANKAVILTCGGYAANEQMMQSRHFQGMKMTTVGSPANTGDGLNMGLAAGGTEMHCGKSYDWFDFAFSKPSDELGTAVTQRRWDTSDLMLGTERDFYDSRIFVNLAGERFMDETITVTHNKEQLAFMDLDGVMLHYAGWKNMPAFLVCDDSYIKSTAIGKVANDDEWTWLRAQDIYEWSDDNQAEIERGWILKADTIEELASQMTTTKYVTGEQVTVDAEALAATIEAFNAECDSGEADVFGRPEGHMKPLVTPPFYAIEMCPCVVYTIGGLASDGSGRVIDYKGEAIPRLYAAGDIGQGTETAPISVSGCMARASIAVADAVKLDPVA